MYPELREKYTYIQDKRMFSELLKMEIRCLQEPITKIVAMFRNLLISSFDATIRVKRAFRPALASRGFASHVFLVKIILLD